MRPFLDQRIDSILAQTSPDWELVICDSHSEDGTWECFQKLKGDERIRLHQVPREGLYAGWNECLARAKGDYVYIAPADDTCSPELLEKMVQALETVDHPQPSLRGVEHRAVDIAVCGFDFIDADGRTMDPPRGTARTFYGDWVNRRHFRSGMLELLVHLCIDVSWTTMTSVLFRRSLLQRTGPFRTDCGAFADRFWAMRSALYSDTVYLPERLATWRWHARQSSAKCSDSMRLKLLRLTADAINECESMIPAEWKEDGAWRSKLLWGASQQYYDGFKLNRYAARSEPLAFLGGCARAALREPQFLFGRLASGLGWDKDGPVSDCDYVRQLIHEWNVPWPPVGRGMKRES